MKKPAAFIPALLCAAAPLFCAGFTLSGTLDTRAQARAGAGETPAFSGGVEQYANLRAQTSLREKITLYGACNITAMTGTFARDAAALYAARRRPPGFSPSIYTAEENYAAGIELERLFFRVEGETYNADIGLTRIAAGCGAAFRPTDFLNPRNPLLPDARPRAALGGILSIFPGDNTKLAAFAAAPRDPFSTGNGALTGITAEHHWDRLSAQGIYVYETPKDQTNRGIHRAGLSAKADLKAGLTVDALYTADPLTQPSADGLAISAGIDYSPLNGELYLLAEYLYSGQTSTTSRNGGNPAGFFNEHYLYLLGRYYLSDYASVHLACLAGFSDYSLQPILGGQYEPLQGLTLSADIRVPLDRESLGADGGRGELGPLPPGADEGNRLVVTLKAALRF